MIHQESNVNLNDLIKTTKQITLYTQCR